MSIRHHSALLVAVSRWVLGYPQMTKYPLARPRLVACENFYCSEHLAECAKAGMQRVHCDGWDKLRRGPLSFGVAVVECGHRECEMALTWDVLLLREF